MIAFNNIIKLNVRTNTFYKVVLGGDFQKLTIVR